MAWVLIVIVFSSRHPLVVDFANKDACMIAGQAMRIGIASRDQYTYCVNRSTGETFDLARVRND